MKMFLGETKGSFKEVILDSQIKKIESQKLQEVLFEISRLSLRAQEKYEYVALVDPAGQVEIRYLWKRNPYKDEKQEIDRNVGFFMTSFWGHAIEPNEVQRYIKDCVSGAWIEMIEMAIHEISRLRYV